MADATNPIHSGESHSSSSSIAFVDRIGAGSSSSSFATSPLGTSSSDTVFTPGATSSSASASAITSSTAPPQTTVAVSAPAVSNSTSNSTILLDWINEDSALPALIEGFNRFETVDLGFAQNDKPTREIVGSLQDDRLWGTAKQDLLRGQSGRDRLIGRSGNDRLNGEAGDDLLMGGKGIDVLVGGSGRDILNGGSESDILIGGKGVDTFVLSQASTSGDTAQADIIVDFQANQKDRIQLPAGISPQQLRFVPFIASGTIPDNISSNITANATVILANVGGTQILLGVALNTVVNGTSTLSASNFI